MGSVRQCHFFRKFFSSYIIKGNKRICFQMVIVQKVYYSWNSEVLQFVKCVFNLLLFCIFLVTRACKMTNNRERKHSLFSKQEVLHETLLFFFFYPPELRTTTGLIALDNSACSQPCWWCLGR